MPSTPEPSLSAGSRFGAYEILGPIASGGMGQVYRARDTRLGREVALKVLPTEVSRDAGRLARFEREARLLASLDDPHIATIHELEEVDGVPALVLELVEGETLAARLGRGPLSLEQALEVARQVALGLESAHGRGVMHRDLKPENIMLVARQPAGGSEGETGSPAAAGRVKILDFGLAKMSQPEPAPDDATRMPTLTAEMTQVGSVMGTAPYMSPEQWRGTGIDERSDIWALGCVIYEMLAGKRSFDGETSTDVAAAVLTGEPEWSALPAATPPVLRRLLERCLEKDPQRRIATASEVRREIEAVQAAAGATRALPLPDAPRRPPFRVHALVPVALALLALLVAGVLLRRPGARVQPIDSVAVLPFESTSADPDGEYLSDGIANSLINSLSKLDDLRVVPRGIAFAYKNRAVDPEEVARELDVRALVTGRVGERDGTLIVGAELVDAVTVSQLWGEEYHRPMADLLEVQEDLVRHIVEELRLELTAEEARTVADPATENPEAYRLYLKTSYHFQRFTPEDLGKAVEYAEQAVALDPGFALAWVSLSLAHTSRAYAGLEPWAEAGAISRLAASRALELDETLAPAWVELGFVRHHFDWDWRGAEEAFARAVELDLQNADALQAHSEALLSLGRIEEAVARAEQAVEANPLNPHVVQWLAFCYLNARRHDDALETYYQALELEPDHLLARAMIPRALLLSGRHEEAVASQIERLQAMEIDVDSDPRLASFYARSGQGRRAREILERVEVEKLGEHERVDLAQALGSLARMDEAFAVLEPLVEERSRVLNFANVHPLWDPLRSDPRFDELLDRMGLPH